jgi:hypothetical protein
MAMESEITPLHARPDSLNKGLESNSPTVSTIYGNDSPGTLNAIWKHMEATNDAVDSGKATALQKLELTGELAIGAGIAVSIPFGVTAAFLFEGAAYIAQSTAAGFALGAAAGAMTALSPDSPKVAAEI